MRVMLCGQGPAATGPAAASTPGTCEHAPEQRVSHLTHRVVRHTHTHCLALLAAPLGHIHHLAGQVFAGRQDEGVLPGVEGGWRKRMQARRTQQGETLG
jgi:hypothetical protein